jgi:peptidoglycan hydrolase-like protein with peptidoglycan-binding domain
VAPDMDPSDDAGVAQLEQAASDAERLEIEADLLEQTDNRPRPEDGEQPSQEDVGPRGLGLRERILARARSQLGIHENPFGSNRTPYSRWYGLVGPWCAMFVSWSFFNEGLPLPASTAKGFAYTPVGAAWFASQKRWTRRPEVGAVIFFDFPGDGVDRISHVGMVEAVNSDGSVTCLEGNTNAPGGRTGGMVMRHRRTGGIVGYGLPKYGAAVSRPDEDPPDPSTGNDLGQGDLGPEVARWQRQLNDATDSRLEVDGEFGPATLKITKAFQKAAGLEPDGKVAVKTRRAMAKALAGRRRPREILSVPRFRGRLIRRGVQGRDVRQWQVQMSKLEFDIDVDGEFGPQTERVCFDFQRKQRLEVDGIVGPATWTASFSRS